MSTVSCVASSLTSAAGSTPCSLRLPLTEKISTTKRQQAQHDLRAFGGVYLLLSYVGNFMWMFERVREHRRPPLRLPHHNGQGGHGSQACQTNGGVEAHSSRKQTADWSDGLISAAKADRSDGFMIGYYGGHGCYRGHSNMVMRRRAYIGRDPQCRRRPLSSRPARRLRRVGGRRKLRRAVSRQQLQDRRQHQKRGEPHRAPVFGRTGVEFGLNSLLSKLRNKSLCFENLFSYQSKAGACLLAQVRVELPVFTPEVEFFPFIFSLFIFSIYERKTSRGLLSLFPGLQKVERVGGNLAEA